MKARGDRGMTIEEAIQNEDREDYKLATEQMEHAHSLRTS